MLLTNRQISRFRKALPNNLSTNIKLSKNHLSKIGQSGEVLSRLPGPLLKTGLPLIESVLKRLVKTPKSVLITLGIIAAASAIDEAV